MLSCFCLFECRLKASINTKLKQTSNIDICKCVNVAKTWQK